MPKPASKVWLHFIKKDDGSVCNQLLIKSCLQLKLIMPFSWSFIHKYVYWYRSGIVSYTFERYTALCIYVFILQDCWNLKINHCLFCCESQTKYTSVSHFPFQNNLSSSAVKGFYIAWRLLYLCYIKLMTKYRFSLTILLYRNILP